MLLTGVLLHGCLQEQEEGDSNVINHHFVKQALQPLLELLLQQLLKQEEDQDRDDTLWNVSMAAGTCIGLIAATVGDDIIPDVMAFVQVPEPLDLARYFI
jgi:importin subunit beta-1